MQSGRSSHLATALAAALGPPGAIAAGIGGAESIVMFQTIKTTELDNVTGAGGSSGIKQPLSGKPAITGTASPSLAKQLAQIHRPGFDFAIAK